MNSSIADHLQTWYERQLQSMRSWLSPTAVEVITQQNSTFVAQQRELEQRLERRRGDLAPVRRELEARRHQLAARNEAWSRVRRECGERLGGVVRAAHEALQSGTAEFGDRITQVLEGLLLEKEDDTVLIDPSMSMTEQLRQRWMAEYDGCARECDQLRGEVEELEREVEELEREIRDLEAAHRDLADTSGQLQRLCRTLRHMQAED